MLKIENRASVVLYNFLISNDFKRPFLMPSNVCPIVPSVFIKANVAFEFVDIDKSMAINKAISLSKIKSDKYSGIIFVHAYGKLFDTKLFFNDLKSKTNNICIIDDRCLCVPDFELTDNGDADLILYSTGYSKYIDLGYGGWGIIKDSYKYNLKILDYNEIDFQDFLKDHKYSLENKTRFLLPNTQWLNSRIFEISPKDYFERVTQALEKIKIQKSLLNNIYKTELPSELQLSDEYNSWRFNILVNERDLVLKNIFNAGLFAGTNYPSVANMFNGATAVIAERYERKIINLFNDFRFDEEKALKICSIINKAMLKPN
jgi:hypothetical protein